LEQALDENRPMAEHALTEIQHLYKIEHMCDDAGLSPDERKAKRHELARPIMEAMKLWMETEGVKYSESHHLCLYPLGQHDALSGGRQAPA
jgi:hypothetical protein